MELDGLSEITSTDELDDIVGPPLQRVLDKERTALHRAWLAASPFCLVATARRAGTLRRLAQGATRRGSRWSSTTAPSPCPTAPATGAPTGSANVPSHPHVGLLHLLPGRGDALRINGRARLLRDAPFFDRVVVRGHHPSVVLLVEVEQVFHHRAEAGRPRRKHCSPTRFATGTRSWTRSARTPPTPSVTRPTTKAFLRSGWWYPSTWDPEVVPPARRHRQEPGPPR